MICDIGVSEGCWNSSSAKRPIALIVNLLNVAGISIESWSKPWNFSFKNLRYIILILNSNARNKLIIQWLNGVSNHEKNGHSFLSPTRTFPPNKVYILLRDIDNSELVTIVVCWWHLLYTSIGWFQTLFLWNPMESYGILWIPMDSYGFLIC